MTTMDDGGPAFPIETANGGGHPGMSLRDYMAVHAPEPTKDQIELVAAAERSANPYGDSHKPVRHSWQEIRCLLRYRWADAMLAMRKVGAYK